MTSEMQEIIAHSANKAFKQGVIKERERILAILHAMVEAIEGGENGQDGITAR